MTDKFNVEAFWEKRYEMPLPPQNADEAFEQLKFLDERLERDAFVTVGEPDGEHLFGDSNYGREAKKRIDEIIQQYGQDPLIEDYLSKKGIKEVVEDVIEGEKGKAWIKKHVAKLRAEIEEYEKKLERLEEK